MFNCVSMGVRWWVGSGLCCTVCRHMLALVVEKLHIRLRKYVDHGKDYGLKGNAFFML